MPKRTSRSNVLGDLPATLLPRITEITEARTVGLLLACCRRSFKTLQMKNEGLQNISKVRGRKQQRNFYHVLSGSEQLPTPRQITSNHQQLCHGQCPSAVSSSPSGTADRLCTRLCRLGEPQASSHRLRGLGRSWQILADCGG